MSDLATGLTRVLGEQTELVRNLVAILQADQQRIIRHDVEALEKSNAEKEELVLRLQSAEAARRQLTERLGTELGLAPEDQRVSSMCPLLGAPGAELERAAGTLRAVVGSLAELVALSRGFLEQSILGIRSVLALLLSLRAPEPQGYDASGRFAVAREQEPVSIRREV
jgi:flagellar biosynthesis/type III secretory pathway chaperone